MKFSTWMPRALETEVNCCWLAPSLARVVLTVSRAVVISPAAVVAAVSVDRLLVLAVKPSAVLLLLLMVPTVTDTWEKPPTDTFRAPEVNTVAPLNLVL